MSYDPRKMPLPYATALGAALIMAGLVADGGITNIVGLVLLIAGWSILANSVTRNASNVLLQSNLPYIAAAIIMGALFAKKHFSNSAVKMLATAGFIGGWMLFVWSMNQHKEIAFGSAILVFISMLIMLPKQRLQCNVDGAGWPIFIAGMLGIVIANSDLLDKPIGHL